MTQTVTADPLNWPTDEGGDDALRLADEKSRDLDPTPLTAPPGPPWKVLIADDEEEVHAVTKLALADFQFGGRPLEFISAYSGVSTKELLRQHPDIAVLLLDVVMESNDSGLQVVQYTRQQLGNNFVRIVLRTGHPGMAPERQVIRAYDINDYRAKTELTQDRMFSVMHTSLSAYQQLTSMARGRFQLRALASEVRQIAALSRGDLRSAAKAIAGDAARLRKSLHESEAAGYEQELARITQQAARIRQLAGGIGKLGRIGTESQIWRDTEFEIAAQVARERLADQFPGRAARIRIGTLPTIPAYPQLIEELFYQVLGLGLRNPQSYSGDIGVNAKPAGRNWEFSISGALRGLSAAPDSDPFAMFTDIGFATSVGGPDTGVGLAMAAKIVLWHGGRIWMRGDDGEIAFSIPAAPPEPVALS